jgi:hypothetical protein
MQLCPHGTTAQACPTCFQKSERERLSKPREQGPPRVPLSGAPLARVQSFDGATQSPHAAALVAKKQAAYEAMASRLPPTPEDAPREETREERDARHERRRAEKRLDRAAPRRVEDVDVDESIPREDMAMLEQLYPARPSIIDRAPRHPDAPGQGGSSQARPVVRGTTRR